jgi:hypothetical protein
MEFDECIHGMVAEWCAICNGADANYGQDDDYELVPELTFDGLLNGLMKESGAREN